MMYKKSICALITPILCLTFGVYPTTLLAAPAEISQKWYGVSRAGAEFNPHILPGVDGVDFTYSTKLETLEYFKNRGLTVIRLPILWERLQPTLEGPLNTAHVEKIRAVLDTAYAAHTKVLLDLHNYGRYNDKPLNVSDWKKLSDVWKKLLAEVDTHPALFGAELMNEPHDLPEGSGGWRTIVQNIVYDLRAQNIGTTILAPGYSWQSARFWKDNNKDFLIHDPEDNLIYAAHQYFDDTYTGTYDVKTEGPVSRGSERIAPFIEWLKFNNKKGMITEYGAPENDSTALRMMNTMLTAVDNSNELLGAIYWASGAHWGNYPLSIEPRANGRTAVQMEMITNFPTRSNPPTLPLGVREGDFVRFRGSNTIFVVETSGLRPFSSLAGYEKAKSKNSKARLITRLDQPDLYTIRWRAAELPIITELSE